MWLSNADGEMKPVCAKFSSEAERNWISGRIVRRLGLKSYEVKRMEEAWHEKECLLQTGRAVEFVRSGGPRDSEQHHRFYIVEHAGFDILFGAEFLKADWKGFFEHGPGPVPT